MPPATRRQTPTAIATALVIMSAAAVCASCSGAADPDQAREAWLRTTLIDDNRHLIERDPDLAAGKLTKMAATPYAYFRGTLGQYQRDQSQPGPGYIATDFVSGASASVLLVGDPHVENIGSFRDATGALVADFNDFDSASYGAWVLDLRRLATSFWVAAHSAGAALALDDPEAEATAQAQRVAEGYADELEAIAAGGDLLAIRRGAGLGAIVDDLLRRAERDGDAREKLEEYTQLGPNGQRAMRFGDLTPPADGLFTDTVQEVPDAERALVLEAVARWPASLVEPVPEAATRFKGVSRRQGAGVSSYPVLRYYVLVEGPTEATEDDWLLEFKEIGNPPPGPAQRLPIQGTWRDNAQRVALAQRSLQESNANDPLLGWAVVGGVPLKVRHRTAYQKGIGTERIEAKLIEGDWALDDLSDLAHLSGRLLARAHAFGRTLQGATGLEVIEASYRGRRRALVDETRDFAVRYGALTLDDHAMLRDMLDRYGPTLGYRPRARWP